VIAINTLALELPDFSPMTLFVIGFLVIGGIFVLLGSVIMLKLSFHKIQQGTAIVRTGLGGARVEFSRVMIYPIVHRAEIMDISVKRIEIYRHGSEGLVCKDNIRADIKVCFFVRVNNDPEDVLKVAQSIGCVRASNQAAMVDLFDAKFSEALKTVGKQFDFTDLYSERDQFKLQILKVIGTDLNGFVLDDAAIDYLEQTPMNLLDTNNILDAEGIKKITDLTAKQQILANSITRSKERIITKENVETREAILELERQQAEATERQKREVSNVTNRERAEAAKVSEEERLKAEKAKIAADEELGVARQNMDRQIIVASRAKERTDKVEIERVERDRALEATERERVVTLAQIAKEKAVEQEKKNIQDVIRERVIVERAVAEQEEKIKDTREFALAERKRKVDVTAAETDAQESLVKETRGAEAHKQAAQFMADQVVIEAEAARAAAEKNSQAKKMLAEATAAEVAAPGLAEAEVIHAKAAAMLKQGESEAAVLLKKMEAESAGEVARSQGITKVGEAEAGVIQKRLEAQASGDLARAAAISKVGESEASVVQKLAEAQAEGLRRKLIAEAEGITQKADAMKKLDGIGKDHEEYKIRLDKEKAVELAQVNVQAQIASSQAVVVGEALKSAKIEIIGGEGKFFEQIVSAVSAGKTVERALEHSPALRDVKETFFSGDSDNFRDQVKRIMDMLNVTPADIRDLTVAAALTRLIGQAKDKPLIEQLRGILVQARQAGVDSDKLSKYI
jgi:flotillin